MAIARAQITISHLVDIVGVTRYYCLQSSTMSTPSKPTTNPPSNVWTLTEPSYTSGSTNTLYFVDLTEFTNGTFKYSNVSVSSSYEAAKAAYNKATNVEGRITLAETQITQNTAQIELRATKTEVETISGEVSNAQTTANEAYTNAASNESRITVSESVIQQISDAISMLVTDDSGTSMMTQTSTGWTFNIGAIQSSLNNAVDNLETLSETVYEANEAITNLNDLANDLAKKTAYIIMSTDDDGNPCIELGKEGSDFRLRITNTSVDFMEGSSNIAYVNNQSLYIERAIINNELQIGAGNGFIWKRRDNGNMGLRWIGGEV